MPALSAELPIFSFQFSLLCFHCGGFNTQYRTSDVAENLGRYVSCTERTTQGKYFELILAVKIETRQPVEGQFNSEFPAICNHCGVMTAWSRKAWKFCEQFLLFFEKRPLTVKFFKILFQKFSPPHRSTLLCSNVVKFVRRKIGEIVGYLPDQKKQNFGCFSNCRHCADRAQNLPGPAPNNVLTVLQISS